MAGMTLLHSAVAGRANGVAGLGVDLDLDSVMLGHGAYVRCGG